MTRREWIKGAAVLPLAGCATGGAETSGSPAVCSGARDFAIDRGALSIRHPLVRRRVRFTVVADAHFAFIDARDAAYADHARRMAQWPNREANLDKALAAAKKFGAACVPMIGDMISFPSHANVEFLARKMNESGLDCRYVAGNHDWHFEGVPGSDSEQRAQWIPARLKALYAGEDPLAYAITKQGLRFVFLDDSTYDVSDAQLAFVRAELARGLPTCFFQHIPFWTPLKPGEIGTLACPDWGAKTDANWQIERRQKWPATGPRPNCFELQRLVFSAANTVAVFAGHTHYEQAATFGGVPQFMVRANTAGAFLNVEVGN